MCFLVRKGNPKGIKDWEDLAEARRADHHAEPEDFGRRALELSRGLGLRAEEIRLGGQGEGVRPEDLSSRFRCSIPGARGSTVTFVERGQGDVLLAWENEAYLSVKEFGAGQVRDRDAVRIHSCRSRRSPSSTRWSTSSGTRAVAEAYLKFLYTKEGQEIAAKNFYRPRSKEVADKYAEAILANVALFTIDEVFGGWQKAQKTHFADGGVFDQIYGK